MQVGVSFVSVADARSNIDAEQPGWDIAALRQRDTATWNQLLGRIQVSGGTYADERTFYSELYHSLLHPNVFDDANGDYIGFDGKVHVADGLHAVRQLLAVGHLPQRGAAARPGRPPADQRHGHLPAGRRRPGRRPPQVARGQPRERPDERGLRRRLHRVGLRLRGPGLRRPPARWRTWSEGPPTPMSPTAVTSSARTWPSTWPRATSRPTPSTSRRSPTPWAPRRPSSTPSTTSPSRSWPRRPATTPLYRTFLARAQNWQNLVNPATGYLAGAPGGRDLPARARLPALAAAGHRPGRVRRGQRHPVHLERPPEPAGPLRRARRQRAPWWPS